jgi:predicted O-methyltransferase YrrM
MGTKGARMARKIKINNISDIKSLISLYGPDCAKLYQSGFNMLHRNAKAAVRTCEAHVMYCICRNFGYKNILEIGTGTGFSSLVFAKAIIDQEVFGSVDTIDINPESPNIFNKNFSRIVEALPEMESMITFYNKDSVDIIPFLDKKYDLAFIDGCHDYDCVKSDYEAVTKKVKDGGCIIFHDVVKTPDDKKGIWDVIAEIKESNKKVIHLNEKVFDFFNYQEDVSDAKRMGNKWKTKEYLHWVLKTGHNPKELLAITFK